MWSETIGLALDIAPKLQAGVVWVNATNLFDAAVGFGGYRESGFGREGGREGVYEYLKPKAWAARKPRKRSARRSRSGRSKPAISMRPRSTAPPSCSSAASRRGPTATIRAPSSRPTGKLVGEVGEGNRKDIRNAVAAARGGRGLVARHRA